MTVKYKVNELAKDLNVPAKDILELIEKYFKEKKAKGALLTKEEVNVVLDYFSQKNQVSDFDAYFASANAVKEKKA